jgi:peptidoglycan/LPS O-acetylase OafA/YrhL
VTVGSDTGRDRYFDVLRAVAILRVVTNHAFPFTVLEVAFPSMGVMFALGGSLMAQSMRRSPGRAVRGRLRRLLPALWVMGAVLVPLMLATGWADRPVWPRLLFWVLPLSDPPANQWGMNGAGVLWYLVTYLWLVLMSPILIKLYRRMPIPAVVLPLLLLGLSLLYPGVLGEEYMGSPAWVITNVLTFGSCWILGFAHRDGHLRRIRPAVVVALATGCVGASLGWAFTHPGDNGVNLLDAPLAYAVYCLAFTLVLMRWSPPMRWLSQRRVLDGLVTLVNARAVTIYLWHNLAIAAAVVIGARLQFWQLGSGEHVAYAAIIVVLLLDITIALGWVEDLAARRPARLLPWPRHRDNTSTTAASGTGQTGSGAATAAPEPLPTAEPALSTSTTA